MVSHDITDHVKGGITHKHDTWCICGAVRGDIVVMRDGVIPMRSDVVMLFLLGKYGP